MRDIAVAYLRKLIKKHRIDKIHATQRGVSVDELRAIEDKLHAAIWLLTQIGEVDNGQSEEDER